MEVGGRWSGVLKCCLNILVECFFICKPGDVLLVEDVISVRNIGAVESIFFFEALIRTSLN